jgi:PEP-CTERM motif
MRLVSPGLIPKARFASAFALFIATCIPVAHAGVVYATGFEQPTFVAPVSLAGHDGWLEFNNANTIVENSLVFAGQQAVFVNGNTSNLQAGPHHPDSPVGPLIELSAEIYIASGFEGEWQFAATGPGLVGYIGGIDLVPQNHVGGTADNIELISGAFPVVGTFNLNTWNLVDFVFNMTSQTYNFSLNGTSLATGANFCGSNSGCSGANVPVYGDSFFDTFGGVSNSDSGFMDNFSLSNVTVASTPEPGCILLFGSGLALVGWRKLARR